MTGQRPMSFVGMVDKLIGDATTGTPTSREEQADQEDQLMNSRKAVLDAAEEWRAEVDRLRESNKELAALIADCRRTIAQNMRHFGGRMHEEELVLRIDAALAKATEGRDGAAEPHTNENPMREYPDPEHLLRHRELHAGLDELVADWMVHTKGLPSQAHISDLMWWSNEQQRNPTPTRG